MRIGSVHIGSEGLFCMALLILAPNKKIFTFAVLSQITIYIVVNLVHIQNKMACNKLLIPTRNQSFVIFMAVAIFYASCFTTDVNVFLR